MVSSDRDSGCLTVYYDGSCPLCRAEIGVYQRASGDGSIHWQDVSACPAGRVAPDLDQRQAMRRFHVRDADGRLISGGRAFAHLWAAIPRYGWLGRLFRREPLATVLDGAYALFLPLRPYVQRAVRRFGS